MGIMTWATKLAGRFLPHPVAGTIGLVRKILRAIVSWATKIDESLPNIVDTMKVIDPGQAYGDWSKQYRTQMQGLSMEKRLALWPKDKVFDKEVITQENLRRASKYRYIFSMEINDAKTGESGWRMFSAYYNTLATPQQVIDKFFYETLANKYDNSISYSDYSFYRVQAWNGEGK